MRILYDIAIRLYWLAAWIISPWNAKARQWISGHRGWLEKLKKSIDPDEQTIWFHCASLGEFEQGRPVLENIRKRYPGHRILLTFFSPSGYEKRKNYEAADHVMYLPLDTARNARRMVNQLRLEMVFFVKYEFWYHFLSRLKKSAVPLYLISGNFREEQPFFKWYGGWYRKFLSFFTHLFVQQERSRDLLLKSGISPVTVAGDTRFDRVMQVAGTEYRNRALESFAEGHRVIVAGSTWERDETLLLHAYRNLPADTRWIIAPHELTLSHISSLQDMFPQHILFTGLDRGLPKDVRVVIVDTIGQLSFLYRFGTLAYIGGGFGKGIHNILEAAAYSIPVIIGPNYRKFLEAVELISIGGAFAVLDENELLLTIHQQLNDDELLKKSSQIAGTYVITGLGATSTITDAVCKSSRLKML